MNSKSSNFINSAETTKYIFPSAINSPQSSSMKLDTDHLQDINPYENVSIKNMIFESKKQSLPEIKM